MIIILLIPIVGQLILRCLSCGCIAGGLDHKRGGDIHYKDIVEAGKKDGLSPEQVMKNIIKTWKENPEGTTSKDDDMEKSSRKKIVFS